MSDSQHIDFSQSHINKNLDNVPDGVEYVRIKKSTLLVIKKEVNAIIDALTNLIEVI